MKKLTVEKFGRDQTGRSVAPPMGMLGLFLTDIATQLGYTMPEPDEDNGDNEGDED